MDRIERRLAHRPRRAARRRRHPALPVDDAGERKLLGEMVELVPLVVRVVLGRIGDLGEREEPVRDLHAIELHASGSRTAIVTRDVAHSLPSSLRISTSHSQVVRPRWIARASACTRARADRAEEARVVRHAERHLAEREHAVGGAPRRERLGDRGVHPAVHDAHRLAHGRHHRAAARCGARPPRDRRPRARSRLSKVSSMASRQCSRRVVRYVGHAADSTRRELGAHMGAGTWESHHAITALMFRYAECVDGADFDGIAALFAHGPHHQRGRRRRDRRRRRGAQALRADESRARRRHDPHAPRQQQRDRRHRRGRGQAIGPVVVRRVPADRRAAAPADRERPLPRHVRARRRTTGASTAATSSSTTSATCASTSPSTCRASSTSTDRAAWPSRSGCSSCSTPVRAEPPR